MNYKPDGYSDVAPYLIATEARETIAFLVSVFGAEPLRMIDNEAGRLRHGELRIGDSVVMLADALPEWPAIPSNVHVYVADVDATFQRAVTAGAEIIQAPKQADDADRRCGFRDAGGTTWWVGTQVGGP